MLRHDNADIRLREKGYEVGLINEERHNKFLDKLSKIDELTNLLKESRITPKQNDYIVSINSTPLKDGISLYELLKRPEINMDHINHFIDLDFDDEIKEQVYINIKYEGYIVKANKEAEKMVNLDNKMIPNDIDYDKIHNLASEAKQKLKEVMPTSIGQALRISGVNPADISILMIYLKKEYHYDRRNI